MLFFTRKHCTITNFPFLIILSYYKILLKEFQALYVGIYIFDVLLMQFKTIISANLLILNNLIIFFSFFPPNFGHLCHFD